MLKRGSFIARSSLAFVLAAYAAATTPGTARAYDQAACNEIFGIANVTPTEQFAIEGGAADFGDDPHWFGTPLGKAVACWATDGRVAIRGKLFADDFHEPVEAIAKIRFQRVNGTVSGTTTSTVQGAGGFPASVQITRISPPGNFNRARIQLFTFTNSALGPATRLVATKTLHR